MIRNLFKKITEGLVVQIEVSTDKQPDIPEPMLRWFKFDHLPESLQDVSRQFANLASAICEEIDRGPERTVALRKLLESKDAAVRARLDSQNNEPPKPPPMEVMFP